MRNSRPGSIQSAVREAISAVGGLENASTDLGVSVTTLSYGTEANEARPGGLGVNYLDRLGRMDADAAEPIASHFAALAGGVFQPVDIEQDDDPCLITLTGDAGREWGEFQSASLRFAQQTTANHRDEALRELDDVITAALRLRAAIATDRQAPGVTPMRKAAS